MRSKISLPQNSTNETMMPRDFSIEQFAKLLRFVISHNAEQFDFKFIDSLSDNQFEKLLYIFDNDLENTFGSLDELLKYVTKLEKNQRLNI